MFRLQILLPLLALISLVVLVPNSVVFAGDPSAPGAAHGDSLLTEYFQQQVAEIETLTFAGIETLEDWEAQRGEYRRQLAEMLGLDPMPPKTPLKPVITGVLDHEEFTVEKLHFQSSPGLYVTGNLYIPKGLKQPAPTVLYVCGHAQVKEGDISFGNKVAYQHHAIWFARHGYLCLIIDTLQLGEIEGLHHGTYYEGMWWWHSCGYTPAGVEAWNCIRALDYLETRPEVDASRFGVTGRSGGGATSWWIAALDERIQVAVPVAGICSLRNHLLGPFETSPWSRRDTHGHDGCIEGHCDCMYFINTYRWDFPMVAALVAPRPLLIANTDKDDIFPLEGVYDVYTKVQKIYDLYDATDKLGLQICAGPHEDTQRLRVPAFQWMNRHLQGKEPLIDVPAEKLFTPQDLRVFNELPADQINTAIHNSFVPVAAEPSLPTSEKEWRAMRSEWMHILRERVFCGWPDEGDAAPLDVEKTFSTDRDGARLSLYEFTSQAPYRLEMYVVTTPPRDLDSVENLSLTVVDESRWRETVAGLRGLFPEFKADSRIDATSQLRPWVVSHGDDSRTRHARVTLIPRGVGQTAWTNHATEQTHIKRRFALIGQTLDGMRVWDLRRGLQAVRSLVDKDQTQIHAQASGPAAGWLLAASLFEPPLAHLRLDDFESPASPSVFLNTPVFLNMRRFVPAPALLAIALEKTSLTVRTAAPAGWQYAQKLTRNPFIHGAIVIDTTDPKGTSTKPRTRTGKQD